jgi:hypothetical protein
VFPESHPLPPHPYLGNSYSSPKLNS